MHIKVSIPLPGSVYALFWLKQSNKIRPLQTRGLSDIKTSSSDCDFPENKTRRANKLKRLQILLRWVIIKLKNKLIVKLYCHRKIDQKKEKERSLTRERALIGCQLWQFDTERISERSKHNSLVPIHKPAGESALLPSERETQIQACSFFLFGDPALPAGWWLNQSRCVAHFSLDLSLFPFWK